MQREKEGVEVECRLGMRDHLQLRVELQSAWRRRVRSPLQR